MAWLSTILHIQPQQSEPLAQFQAGQPAILPPRWRVLIQKNPQFVQGNRVSCGICALPQGPEGCTEYMNCTDAEEGGCRWFATDPEDEQMQIEIEQRAAMHRQQEKESMAVGKVVQADKHRKLAQRTEALQEEVHRHTSEEMLERLRARKREIEEGDDKS